MDRHALLAMTYMVDYVTARGLTADVAVQTLTVSSVWVMDRRALLAMTMIEVFVTARKTKPEVAVHRP